MQTITVNLSSFLEEILEHMVVLDIFPSKSEGIRTAIRHLLLSYGKLAFHRMEQTPSISRTQEFPTEQNGEKEITCLTF